MNFLDFTECGTLNLVKWCKRKKRNAYCITLY